MDNRDFFMFTLGAATGAAIGLLFAPQSGTETRDQVAQWTDQTRSKLKEYSDVAAEKARDVSQKVRETATQITGKAQQKMQEVQAGVQTAGAVTAGRDPSA